jgi:ribosomal protein S27AE
MKDPECEAGDALSISLELQRQFTDEFLESYSLGRLNEAACEVLEKHLLICEECRERLSDADHYVGVMRSGLARLRKSQQACIGDAEPAKTVPGHERNVDIHFRECPRCRTLSSFARFAKIDRYTCQECGEVIVVQAPVP